MTAYSKIQNIRQRPRDLGGNSWNDRHESTKESEQDEVCNPSSSEIDPIGILVHLRWIRIRWLCLANNFCSDHLEKLKAFPFPDFSRAAFVAQFLMYLLLLIA